MRISDWSSDVCSSDLGLHVAQLPNSYSKFRFPRVRSYCSKGKQSVMLAQPSYLFPDMEGEALPDPLFGQTPTSFLCETAQFSWRGGIIGEDQDFSMTPQHSRGTQHRPRAAHSAHIHPQCLIFHKDSLGHARLVLRALRQSPVPS